MRKEHPLSLIEGVLLRSFLTLLDTLGLTLQLQKSHKGTGIYLIKWPTIQQAPQTSTLQYPIVDTAVNAPMKAIPLQNIPTFHGLTSKDPDAFLFEFDVLCRGYEYTTDPQKLKLFPSTLKGVALQWFMGLGGGVINNWDQMKTVFLKKYQDYCRYRELKDEIFQMTARPSETLEVEHF